MTQNDSIFIGLVIILLIIVDGISTYEINYLHKEVIKLTQQVEELKNERNF